MVLTYKECVDRFGSDYMIRKEISRERLFQKEKGIYSTNRNCSALAVISVKYPKAVFTGESAFYYHGLTDVIPDTFHLATLRSHTRIKDNEIEQTFTKEELFDMGIVKMQYQNTTIQIYNLERMLIELVRFKNKLPFDYYKEIIASYRNRIEEMDLAEVEEYADKFQCSGKWMDMIQMEVL